MQAAGYGSHYGQSLHGIRQDALTSPELHHSAQDQHERRSDSENLLLECPARSLPATGPMQLRVSVRHGFARGQQNTVVQVRRGRGKPVSIELPRDALILLREILHFDHPS